jgi:hypothetical protein
VGGNYCSRTWQVAKSRSGNRFWVAQRFWVALRFSAPITALFKWRCQPLW